MKAKRKFTHRRFVISLIHILVLSTIISYITCNIFTYRTLGNKLNENLDRITDTITTLSDHSINPGDIVEMSTSPLYPVTIIDGVNDIGLTKGEYNTFITTRQVKYKDNPLYDTVIIERNGTIYKITVSSVTNEFISSLISMGVAMVIALLISIIIAIIMSKSILRPVRDMSKATQKIAKGDFDVRVKRSKNPELDKLAENFNQMAEELGKMDTLSNDFIRNVSHEFKTPVSSICGFAELLKQSDLPSQQRDYANIIDTEARRLSKLTSSILSLSKLETQSVITEKKEFYIDEQLRQSILLMEKKWTEKNILLDINLEKAKYYGNKVLTEQIWINLIDNAIKYTPENGKIDISCEHNIDAITVCVKDSGIGMSPEVKERVFDKFYQGDSSHSQEGNGLGLSIVKRIVDISNGQITIESQPEKGSTFTVTLPIETN